MRLVLLLVWRFQYYNEIKVLVILEITPSSDHLLRCESGELNPTPGWSGGSGGLFRAVAMAGGVALLSICLS